MLPALFAALHVIGLVTLWGALAWPWMLARKSSSLLHAPDTLVRRVGGLSLVAALMGQALWLPAIAAQMIGSDDALCLTPHILQTVLAGSWFGHVWILRSGVLIIAALLLWQRPTGRPAHVEVLPWAAASLLSLALAGHGATGEGLRRLLLPVLAVHLAAVGAWIGSQPLLCLMLRNNQHAASLLARYRSFALLAAGLAVISGIMAVFLLTQGRPMTFQGDWGHWLFIKIGLVAGVALLGGLNAFILRPHALPVLRWTIPLEYAAGMAAMTVAALLSQSAPPL